MTFKKFTSAYDQIQDRFRLSGERDDGTVLSLWMTARLLKRVIPALINLLSHETSAHTPKGAVQSFEQSTAKAAHVSKAAKEAGPQDPAPAAHRAGNHEMFLIETIEVECNAKLCTLIFRIHDAQEVARLPLNPVELRQWLGIMFRKCTQAGWQIDGWPAWLVEAEQQAPTPAPGAILH